MRVRSTEYDFDGRKVVVRFDDATHSIVVMLYAEGEDLTLEWSRHARVASDSDPRSQEMFDLVIHALRQMYGVGPNGKRFERYGRDFGPMPDCPAHMIETLLTEVGRFFP